ncbi:MAG: DNA polymerase III subunit delta [Bacilli bacterium]
MIYLIYGTENIQIENFLVNKLKELSLTNVSYYDSSSNIDLFLEDFLYMDLFMESKGIVLKDADTFLYNKDNEKILLKVLDNINESTYLFIIVNLVKLDERKTIIKSLLKKSKTIIFNKLDNKGIYLFADSSFNQENYKVDRDALNKLSSYYEACPSLIVSEIEKLKLYKYNDKHITSKDVMEVSSKVPVNNVFKLVDACVMKDYDNIFILLDDLLYLGEDEIKLLSLIASQFRLFLQVLLLKKDGVAQDKIAYTLKVHPYRIKLICERKDNFTQEKLENILLMCYKTDKYIKTGIIDKRDALKMFFLEI